MLDHSTNSAPLLDSAVLERLQAEVGEETLKLLIGIFVDETQTLLDDFVLAIDNDDLASATRLIHSIKSGSLSYGACQLGQLAAAMEQALRQDKRAFVIDNLSLLQQLTVATMQQCAL